MDKPSVRDQLAWLIWCYQQGYMNAGDRALISNWMGDPPEKLTVHDREERDALLEMADEILALVVADAR